MTIVSMSSAVTAVLAVAGLTALLRWAFPPGPRDRRGDSRSRRVDFGLLEPVVTVRLRTEADALRGLLRRHGIRATAALVRGGRVHISVDGYVLGTVGDGWQVLCFHEDAPAARRVVAATPDLPDDPL